MCIRGDFLWADRPAHIPRYNFAQQPFGVLYAPSYSPWVLAGPLQMLSLRIAVRSQLSESLLIQKKRKKRSFRSFGGTVPGSRKRPVAFSSWATVASLHTLSLARYIGNASLCPLTPFLLSPGLD